jgi:murein DD-endopeptidase MepM/ murein hydrolase activator NlpD
MISKAWIDELREQTPENGYATLIITKPSGANYLKLSRQQIDTYRNNITFKKKITLITVSLITILLLALTAKVTIENKDFNTTLLAQNELIEEVQSSLDDLNFYYPDQMAIVSYQPGSDILTSINSLSKLLAIQEETFRFYINYTHSLIHDNNINLLDSLQNAGFSFSPPSPDNEGLSIGGLGNSDGMVEMISLYLEEALLNSLIIRSEVEHFKSELPLKKPLEGGHISSPYGLRIHPLTATRELHMGVDFVSYTNREIYATGDGIVMFSGRDGNYGKKVTIQHANDILTLYAHLDTISVNAGDVVTQGEIIGIMGSTGNSTSAHLHYEVHYKEKPIDPLTLYGVNSYVR